MIGSFWIKHKRQQGEILISHTQCERLNVAITKPDSVKNLKIKQTKIVLPYAG